MKVLLVTLQILLDLENIPIDFGEIGLDLDIDILLIHLRLI